MTDADLVRLAGRVRAALEAADVEQLAGLLDPDVTWGAPGDPAPSCRSRQQVLAWYAGGRAAGRRAQVRDVSAHNDALLVSMTVTTPTDGRELREDRWQVLTVRDGRIADIRGYGDEGSARAAAGLVEH